MKSCATLRRALVVLSALVILLLQIQSGFALAGGYSTRMAVVNEATRHLGEPYNWGSGWPPGFDCSGYINYIMMNAGVGGFYSGPYLHGPTVDIQAESFSYPISVNDLVPGDLLFLDRSYDTNYDGVLNLLDNWSHIGVYAGNNLLLQAGGGSVAYRQLSTWTGYGYNPYAISFAGARRVNTSLWPGRDASFNPKEGIAYFNGDFTGDGKEDLIAFQDYTRGAVGIWTYASKSNAVSPGGITLAPSLWLTGNGAFEWKSAKSVALDFDGDEKTDILSFYKYGEGQTGVLLFKSTGIGFVLDKIFHSNYWSWNNTKLVAGDFDGDGRGEVIALYNYGNAKTGFWLFETGTGGTFQNPKALFYSPAWDWNNTTLVSGSMDGGIRDTAVAVYNYGNTTIGFWPFALNEAGGLIPPSPSYGTGGWDASKASFLMSDANVDGKDDIVAAYNYGGTETGLWVFPSTGSSFSAPQLAFRSNQWDASRSTFFGGDFTGDGNDEFLCVYHYGNGPIGISIFTPNAGKIGFSGNIWYAP